MNSVLRRLSLLLSAGWRRMDVYCNPYPAPSAPASCRNPIPPPSPRPLLVSFFHAVLKVVGSLFLTVAILGRPGRILLGA